MHVFLGWLRGGGGISPPPLKMFLPPLSLSQFSLEFLLLFKGVLFKGVLFKGVLFKGVLFKGVLFKGVLFKNM